MCLHCQNQILSPNSRSETEVFQFHKCTNLILSGKEKNEKCSQQMWFGCHERYAMVFRYLTLCLLKKFSDQNGKGLSVDCECEWLRRVIHEMIAADVLCCVGGGGSAT